MQQDKSDRQLPKLTAYRWWKNKFGIDGALHEIFIDHVVLTVNNGLSGGQRARQTPGISLRRVRRVAHAVELRRRPRGQNRALLAPAPELRQGDFAHPT